LPVHHDDEYRIRLERDQLLRRLGIGVDSKDYLQMSLSTTLEKNDSDRARKTALKRADWLEGGVASNTIALLRVVVMQNEVVLYALKRLDEAVTARPRPFNPADWK